MCAAHILAMTRKSHDLDPIGSFESKPAGATRKGGSPDPRSESSSDDSEGMNAPERSLLAPGVNADHPLSREGYRDAGY